MKMKTCFRCNTGKPRRELVDARGIFCSFVCDDCEKKVRKGYRPDIFSDSNYWTDEEVEPS